MFVSIIIPTFKDWDRLRLCLDALCKQSYPASNFEIIIVNNDPGSIPSSSTCLPANAKLLEEGKPGSYAARNRGLDEAKGDLIGFTDSDCVPEPDWIANAVSASELLSEADFRITGPVIMFRNDGDSWLAWKFESITAFNQKHNVRNGGSVTANLFVSRSVFARVGLFDATLFSGGDMAWNKLATRHGVPLVYSNKVVVKHPARATMLEIIAKSRRVLGGGFVQARREGKLLAYAARHMVPPITYARVLVNDGKPILDVMFACTMYWGIKLLMLLEIIRLRLGGTPLRQ